MTKATLLTIAQIDSDPTFLYGVEFRALDDAGDEITYTKHAVAAIGHERHRNPAEGVTAQTIADAMANAAETAPATWRFDSEAGHLFADGHLFNVPGWFDGKEVSRNSVTVNQRDHGRKARRDRGRPAHWRAPLHDRSSG